MAGVGVSRPAESRATGGFATRGLLFGATIAVGLAACASADTSACETAAWSQAGAEQRLASVYEAHEEAHAMGYSHHDAPETDVLGARVAMILAEAETRRQCG